ncbi:MAG: GNAT family N-acetyltransferase [Firmicutes bacterium]|nr:GNAT family N-acetyltransferase [Bacillota bacterium]
MEIIYLKPNDLEETIALLKENFPNSSFQNNINFSKIEPNNMVIIAKYDNHIIGHTLIQKQYDIYSDCYYFYLMYICVKMEYRNLGCATKMLEKVEQLKKEQNISYITFTSRKTRVEANQLYQKLGYQLKDSNVYIKF